MVIFYCVKKSHVNYTCNSFVKDINLPIWLDVVVSSGILRTAIHSEMGKCVPSERVSIQDPMIESSSTILQNLLTI